MKKVSGLVLSTVLVAGMLAGCGKAPAKETNEGGSNTAAPVQLKYWAPFSGGDGDFMKEMVTKFNAANPGIQVEILNLKAEEYYTKLQTSIASNQAPDVAIAHASKLAELTAGGMIQEIGALAPKAGIDWNTYSKNILNSTIVGGKNYAVPLDTHALILFANEALVKDAGLLDASGKVNLGAGKDGFMKSLQTLKGKLPAGTFPVAATSNGDSPLRIWWTLYSQMNGKLLSDDGKTAAFNNDKGKQALAFMNQMVNEDLWPKNTKNGGEIFTAAKGAIMFNGAWMTGSLEQNQALKFVAMPIPQLFERKATWGDSHTFVLPMQKTKDEAKQTAALKFADWITSNSATWAKAGHVPSKPAVLKSDEFKSLKYRSDYVEIADYVSYMPNSPKISAVLDIFKKHLNVMMNGQATPEQTLERAEKEINELLAK
ncbi:extracellular solute-binding protein [Paenibacillus silviterrae]|uniref:extracellular solute-binding protein n=1 Tax=Paenibacillus silviterrae TaxID=3242194 RepID=UPI002543DBAC|nr:extracellular solute-binding protein [Paenibacillus chinjuensis]